jgi:hypothetical protein
MIKLGVLIIFLVIILFTLASVGKKPEHNTMKLSDFCDLLIKGELDSIRLFNINVKQAPI